MMKNDALHKKKISVPVSILSTLAACLIVYEAEIPNPVIVLVVVMTAFTALIGSAAGAASGLVIIAYAFFFFSENHSFIHITREGMYKCQVIVVSILAMYVLVSFIRHKRDEAFQKLKGLNEKLEAQNAELEEESSHDPLTGIYNRRGGKQAASSLMKTLREKKEGGLLCTMDIDDFKNINDAYGHDTGDRVLQYLVGSLEKEFTENGILIRTGGDEFQIALYGRSLTEMEKQIRDFCARTFSFSDAEQKVSFRVSCGYAEWPRQAEDPQDLSRKADIALYCAKVNGRRRALLYREDMENVLAGEQKFSLRNAAENLPVAFLVYRADEKEEILLSSESLLEMCECADFGEFMTLTGGSFHGFVHPDDLARVEKSIADQIAENRYGLDAVNYRIVSKSGRVIRIHDIGRLIHDPNLGDLFYVVVYDRDAVREEI